MKKNIEGQIINGIDGFFFVDIKESIIKCKARGVFRKKRLLPLAGDKVIISINFDGTGAIEEIIPRKNAFIRPPIANVDVLLIVASTCKPLPNLYNIDMLITVAFLKNVQPVVVFTKIDLKDASALEEIYRTSKIPVVSINCKTGDGLCELNGYVGTGVTVLTGNTGVGKSSIINLLVPNLNAAVGDISENLGRGRHTTRECVLYPFEEGYITDTAGFSNLDLLMYKEELTANELQFLFPEFQPFLGTCKFTSCSHTVEDGCSIIVALRANKICSSRHNDYCKMYRELKGVRYK